jgi:DNA processing protein
MFGLSQAIAGKIYFGLKDIGVLEKEVGLMAKNNVNFVTIESTNYPEMLREIYAPPTVLYIKSAGLNIASSGKIVGTVNDKNRSWEDILNYNKKIAFVGSRKANSYGEKIVDEIVPVMVENDWVVVSGGAIGADSMAHAKTVSCGGLTIAIIGSGLSNPYPSSNEKLFEDILSSGGLILSPFGMQTVARPGNFPARNRVIAGLSLGCVVVQAAKKSGASITAQLALDNGREVFAVPGLFYDELSIGCHALIQQGAKIISDAYDILVEFPGLIEAKAFGQDLSKDSKRQISQNQVSHRQVIQGQISKKQDLKVNFAGENNLQQAQEYGVKTANIIESLKVKSQNSQNHKSDNLTVEKSVSKYKNDSIEFEIMRICTRACSLDEIAVATNKSMSDLHEVLFDMQISGDIKQNYAGMFEII